MAHDKGSFDYKTINEKIKQVLTTRSQLDNTVQVSMPFVKATTTIHHPEFLGAGNIGFTLGLHAINEDVKYEDIYSDKELNTPLIGYTYQKDGTSKRVYAFNPLGKNNTWVSSIFDRNAALFDSTNFIRIPPPGITNVTIGRARNGLLASADLQISVPSLIQLESLHRLFLVPGLGMVLEWGQQFAQERTSIDYSEKPNISQNMFPWYNRSAVDELMVRLGDNQIGLEEIIDKYVIPSEGQYMWMFGRVANFTVKSNSDGSSTCNVKIVGPSEDSWAYSTKSTVVPAKANDGSARFYCASKTTSVYSYFAETATNPLSFKTLLDDVYSGKNKKLTDWRDHIQRFDHVNKPEEPQPNDTTAKISEKTFADAEDAYFISWRFFVNVVLNDEEFGLRAIFKQAVPDELKKIALLLPYADGQNRENKNVAKLKQIDDPMESYVGMNKFLRSTDPSAMIIVNEMAAKLAEQNPQYNIPGAKENFLNPEHDMVTKFLNSNAGRFDTSAQQNTNDPDRGFLSSGVWLNHKAIVEAFLQSDTILRGITNLLQRMNQATENYWELTIDTAQPIEGMDHSYNYMVVDAHRRESSDKAVSKFLDKVHVFNKYVRVDRNTNKLVGSELIDCSVDLSLPKRLFSQIATLGLIQSSDMKATEPQPTLEERLSALEDPTKKEKSPKISDPNDTLREMFAITSLSQLIDGKSPDLTIPEKVLRQNAIKMSGVCGKSNTQLTAQTAGQGNRTGNTTPEQADTKQDGDYAAQKAESTKWLQQNAVVCQKCEAVKPKTKFTNAAPKTLEQVIKDATEYNKYYEEQKLDLKTQKNSDGNKIWPREGLIAENTLLFNMNLAAFPNTSGHMDRSAHNVSQAMDISVHSPDLAELVMRFWKSKGYEVVDEYNRPPYNHIHIEWDLITEPQNTTTPVILTDEEKAKCEECYKRQEIVRQIETKEQETAVVLENKLRQFYGLEKIFRYVEVFPEYMISHITDTANGSLSNAFGASPGSLAIKADLTLPGINGFRVGELFWIDRIPAFYKAFGAFQIMSLEDKIDMEGWKTNIHAQFNFLGNDWKRAMAEKLSNK